MARASSRCSRATRQRSDAWRLDSRRPAARRGRVARRRHRHARAARPRRHRRDPSAGPVGDGGLPARRRERRRFRRRVVPHRRRRLDRARRMGAPHRPVEGNDQGQRLPGRAGRDRGGAARPSRGARLRGVRPGRRRAGRGARSPSCSSTPTQPWPTPNSRQLVADSLATYKQVRHVVVVDTIPRLPSGKVLRRTLRDEWTPEAHALMDVRFSPEQGRAARRRRAPRVATSARAPSPTSTTRNAAPSSKPPSPRRVGATYSATRRPSKPRS